MRGPLIATLAGLALLAAAPGQGAETRADREALVRGNNQFALELYAKLQSREGNLFCSPFSISSALAMTYAGARGQTAEQMAKTLHFSQDNATLHPAFAALIKEINGVGKDPKKRGYQLSTANALWPQKGYAFLPEYRKLITNNYGAGEQEVDYVNATEAARQTINAWVEKETHDKIKDLIKDGVLTSDTRLVLTNAIYFKGDWASQFKKDVTREEVFHLSAEKKTKAPLMHQTGLFNYFANESAQVLELPYVGKDLSMVVLLPRKLDGLEGLEKSLTADRLVGVLKNLHPQEVVVRLPRFKTTAEFQLGPTLSRMGMPLAFQPSADFSGLHGGKERLWIGAVIHKAFVDVNEEGTEAAAATAVEIKTTSEPPPPPVFRADHPFVFLIRDRRSDSILFIGRLADPQK